MGGVNVCYSVLKVSFNYMYVKVLVGNFNQEKALAGAFSVITKLLVEALISTLYILRSL